MGLLELRNVDIHYQTDRGAVEAVEDVSFELEEGETLGLVGESGSGKTTTAKSIMRLLDKNGSVVGGEIDFKGTDVTELSMKELKREIRWKEVAMIPQNAMNGFDPVYTVGQQIAQIIHHHYPDTSKKEGKKQARELFEELGLQPDRVDDYPHQLSGGMAQRAMITLALACQPSLILADEPTTALDVVIQDKILDLLKDIQDDLNNAIILITHDMSVVSETCDTIAVMYAGRIVEMADAETIIKNPAHPYTLGLRNAFPDITEDDQELISIPGTPPELIDPDEGCRFAPRCPFAEEECWEVTPEDDVTPEPPESVDGHVVECHFADEAEMLREEAGKRETWWSSEDEEEEEAEHQPATDGGSFDGGHDE
jgi:peptide/nickel transport system ATP-binding protein